MVIISDEERKIIEKSILLPMLLTVLERDRQTFEQLPFKLKHPYLVLLEKTMKAIQKDLRDIKMKMKKGNMKVFEKTRDEAFTMYTFFYNGYEEPHNYYNLNIRNKVEKLLEQYLLNTQPPLD